MALDLSGLVPSESSFRQTSTHHSYRLFLGKIRTLRAIRRFVSRFSYRGLLVFSVQVLVFICLAVFGGQVHHGDLTGKLALRFLVTSVFWLTLKLRLASRVLLRILFTNMWILPQVWRARGNPPAS